MVVSAASPMIRCADRTRSREQTLDRASAIAAGLAGLGVRPNDRVAIVLRNDIEFVEISIGIGLIGAVPIAVNWHWRRDELNYLLTDSGAVAAFVHSDLLPTVEAALGDPIPLIQVTPSDALRKAYRLDEWTPSDRPELEEWLAGRSDRIDRIDRIDRPIATPMSVIYTSGTTGRPKGVLREPQAPEHRARFVTQIFSAFGLAPGMRTLVPAPLYHTAPNSHSLGAFATGHDLTIMPRFDPVELLATIERERIEHTQMVPAMFVRLLALPEEQRRSFDLSSLAAIVHAAAPCSPEIKHQMIDWLGPIILEYYGGTESGAVVCCDSTEWLAHPGTVGHPMSGTAIRVYREDGSEAPTGEVGEIYVKTADGWPDFTYIGNDAKRRAMERDGYLTLGDVGRMDDDDYLYLSDRKDDMVISGGVNIYPAEIEQCLILLDGVRDVAVFGIPDPEYGEALAAHVDTDPASGLTEDDIRRYVRTNLAGYKTPKVVVIDRELPREESGKLFKRRLRDRYRAS